jgi:biopolymer transport protein ExbD
MRIGIDATPDGEFSSFQFLDDQSRARSLDDLEGKVRAKLEASYKGSTPFEQVVLEIDPRLTLQHTMELMDRLLRQKGQDGKQLTKISPVLARVGGGPAK